MQYAVQQMAYGPGGQLQLSADAKKKLLWGKKPGAPSQDAPVGTLLLASVWHSFSMVALSADLARHLRLHIEYLLRIR